MHDSLAALKLCWSMDSVIGHCLYIAPSMTGGLLEKIRTSSKRKDFTIK